MSKIIYKGTNDLIKSWLLSVDGRASDPIRIVDDAPVKDSPGGNDCIILTDKLPPAEVIQRVAAQNVPQVVQFSGSDPEQSLQRAVQFCNFHGRGLPVEPVQVFFGVNPKYHFSMQIHIDSDKRHIVASCQQFIASLPRSSTIVDSSVTILDELVMNVLLDAPSCYLKRFGKNKIFDTSVVGNVDIAADDKRLMIIVSDLYGSLDTTALVGRIEKTFRSEMANVNLDTSGGAGLGCRMIFENSTDTFFVVDRGVKTISGACLPIGQSHRKQATTPKSFHALELAQQASGD